MKDNINHRNREHDNEEIILKILEKMKNDGSLITRNFPNEVLHDFINLRKPPNKIFQRTGY